MNDLRYALRQLLKHPGFTSVAVLTLALGIGVNLALFALFNDQLLRPRTVLHPCLCLRAINRELHLEVGFPSDRLTVATADLEKVGYTTNTAPPMVEELRRRFSLLPGVEAVGVTATEPFS